MIKTLLDHGAAVDGKDKVTLYTRFNVAYLVELNLVVVKADHQVSEFIFFLNFWL